MTLNQIVAYEQGELSDEDTLELFSDLVRSGLVWQLQGAYGRTAHKLIENGYLSPTGEILRPIGEP